MISTLKTDIGSMNVFSSLSLPTLKKYEKLSPKYNATSLQKNPRDKNEKSKKPNMYYYYNINLVSEKNQETKKKHFFKCKFF